jgi:hypothetical protein
MKKIKNNYIDPLFDGHPEKTLRQMTPKEKLNYLWLQMEFKFAVRNRQIKYYKDLNKSK